VLNETHTNSHTCPRLVGLEQRSRAWQAERIAMIMYRYTKIWQFPGGVWPIRSIYTNLHMKILQLKHKNLEIPLARWNKQTFRGNIKFLTSRAGGGDFLKNFQKRQVTNKLGNLYKEEKNNNLWREREIRKVLKEGKKQLWQVNSICFLLYLI
jgi:hypothetical protein